MVEGGAFVSRYTPGAGFVFIGLVLKTGAFVGAGALEDESVLVTGAAGGASALVSGAGERVGEPLSAGDFASAWARPKTTAAARKQ